MLGDVPDPVLHLLQAVEGLGAARFFAVGLPVEGRDAVQEVIFPRFSGHPC